MPRSDPLWKQAFDRLDRTLGERINEAARSEETATVVALVRRGQREFQRRAEQASRRSLHLFNLPAGSDVNRLLIQIAHLEREVRDLRKELHDTQAKEVNGRGATARRGSRTRQTSA